MRRWMWPAIVAVILFAGSMASNLVGAGMEAFVDQYRFWLWVLIGIALVTSVGMAVYDSRHAQPTAERRQRLSAQGSKLQGVSMDQQVDGDQELDAKRSELTDVKLVQK